MSKIVVIATGGTIASRYNPETGKLSSGVMTGNDLVGMIPDLDPSVSLEVKNIFGVPSSFLDPARMFELARTANSELADSEVDGVVVTHGTDTLEESSYLVDLVVNQAKPIVFTGAQRGPLELGSDGICNLRDAIHTAARKESRDKGVLVVFNEEIHSARHVTKTDAYKLEGFRSENFGPLGFVDGRDVRYYGTTLDREHFGITGITARVDLIKVVAGMDGAFVNSVVERGVDGLVVEGFGRGHVPPPMMPALRSAVEQNTVVLVTSRCQRGLVRDVYDFDGGARDLMLSGAIIAPGYPGTKARIKLLAVLSHTRDLEDIRPLFQHNQSKEQ